MRHRKRGRRLGRSSPHRKRLFQNLTNGLFLTEREETDLDENTPKVKGRIVTTLPKAKEVRSMVERCIRIACKSLEDEEKAEEFATTAERGSDEWKRWRESEQWQKWCAARAPVVTARRRLFAMLRNKEAVTILCETIAPRYVDRPGGYTRVLKLAKPRLGDAGAQAILELVGTNDRTPVRAERPAFDMEGDESSESAPGVTAPLEASSGEAESAAPSSSEAAPEATEGSPEEKK
jgi:large subunit ribosomal protein L17